MRNTAEPFTPFDLDNDADYMVWREQKLHDYPAGIEQLMVEVQDPRRLTQAEVEAIRALMKANAMTIPANIRDGREIRPARSGPVFSIFGDGSLHMRYTARTRSIEWSQELLTLAAVNTLEAFLDSSSAYIYRATLQPGQGLICNNVLHDRSGFDDDGEYTRQLYRLRYYQRMADT